MGNIRTIRGNILGRKRWKNNYDELRGRWHDNTKMVKNIIEDSIEKRDWTLRLKHFQGEADKKIIDLQKSGKYKYPPDLRHISLESRCLDKSRFKYADLSGATAYRVHGVKMNCTGADLSQSRWGGAVLTDSIFKDTNCKSAYFSHSNVHNCDFSGANLSYAKFKDANLTGANFRNADLRYAVLSGARCTGADFTGAKLYGASLWGMDYKNITAHYMDISKEGNHSVLTNNLSLASLDFHFQKSRNLSEIAAIVNVNSVIILGYDATKEAMAKLMEIGRIVSDQGYIPIIVKLQQEIPSESFYKKAMTYSLLSKFVLIENSAPSGHVREFKGVLDNGCIIGVLQKEGYGATWLDEQDYINNTTIERFEYQEENFLTQTIAAIDWCQNRIDEYSKQLSERYRQHNLSYVPNWRNRPLRAVPAEID